MKRKSPIAQALAGVMLASLIAPVWAQDEAYRIQTEEEFKRLMPITGTVETKAGDFELDHGFPAPGEAEKIYDLMDHQRATQLYLWGLPITAMIGWHLGNVENYPDYDFNSVVEVTRFNERRGVLTTNETTDYYWGFANTRESALMLEIPPGTAVGMLVNMWQESPGDIGVFGPNAGRGGKWVVIGPNTPAEMIPERSDDVRVLNVDTDHVYYLFRLVGEPEEKERLISNLKIYNYGDEATTAKVIPGGDKFTAQYQPRGLKYWELLHKSINMEVVLDRDRFFMYWLRQLGIEKGKPFNPTERQKEILIDAAETGELMAKTLVYDERMDGVLRQNNWRMILGGEWGDGNKYTNRMTYFDTFDPRARYTYEAVTTSPAMTMPFPGKAQLYIGKFEDEEGQRLKGENNYVIRIEKDVPAELFWSIVIYDTDYRSLIDNRDGAAGGKATIGSRLDPRVNADGSVYMLLGPDAPPEGWENNHVQTLPGRGWFPYMRMYGAAEAAFNDEYKFPTVNKVEDFSEYIK